MARPTVLHDGFLIPNAGDVSNPRMAEPDRVDFNTLAHPLWGVIEGCVVTVAGTTASTAGGTLLVNGQLVVLGPGSVGLGVGGTQDRFVLIVADAAGVLAMIPGEYSVDPVFPDPPLNSTVLAAVFCPTGASTLVDNVIDKRKFISKALLTKISSTSDLIRNVNGTGNHFLIDGGGKVTWENDTWLYRMSAGRLNISKDLLIEGELAVGSRSYLNGDVECSGVVTSKNLQQDAGPPGGSSYNPGDIYQDKTSGRLYVWRSGSWQEIATIASANPPGTVITSLEKPTVMSALGWIPLDGRKVYENEAPNLFTVQGMTHMIVNTTPRHIQLPNANKLAMIVDWDKNAGVKVSTNPNNLVTLVTANLARHGHSPVSQGNGAANPKVTVNPVGDHTHTVTGGSHKHDVTDEGHAHHGMDLGGGVASAVVALVWGGQNKIDALFNDRNHTYSVEALHWTMPSQSNIKVSYESSHDHTANPNGGHEHTATIEGIAEHNHTLTETLVGNGVPFDITPEYLTVYSYVRS